MITRGRYIVIEGNDGTGKSTQVRLLQTYFHKQGYSVVTVEEPGGGSVFTTPVARYLRTIIKNGQLQRDPEINLALFSAARRESFFTTLRKKLYLLKLFIRMILNP